MMKIIVEPNFARMETNEKTFDLLNELQTRSLSRRELIAFATAMIKCFELRIEECFAAEAEAYAAEKILLHELLGMFRKQADELQQILAIFDSLSETDED